MAHEIRVDLEKYSIGVVNTATGEQYRPVKVVEITENCSGSDYRPPVIIVYGRTAQEVLVQFREGGQRGVSWTMKQLKDELSIPEHRSAFGTKAKFFGLTRQRLWEIIKAHLPAAA